MENLKYDKNETYINRTRVLKEYLLTLDDIEDIPYAIRKAHYGRSTNIYLYRLDDIKEKTYQKYGNEFEIIKIDKEIEKEKKKN